MKAGGNVSWPVLALPQLAGIIHEFMLLQRSIGLPDAAPVTGFEHGFQSAGDIIGQQADGAGRRNRHEVTVAYPRRGNGLADIVGQ